VDVLWTLATELSTTVELNVPLATKGDNAICGQCEPNMPVARRAKHKANSLMAPTTASAARTSRIKRAVPPVEGAANEGVKRTAENNAMEVGSKSTTDANPSSSKRSVGGIVGNAPCGKELTDAELAAVYNAKVLVNATIAPSLASDRISHRKAPDDSNFESGAVCSTAVGNGMASPPVFEEPDTATGAETMADGVKAPACASPSFSESGTTSLASGSTSPRKVPTGVVSTDGASHPTFTAVEAFISSPQPAASPANAMPPESEAIVADAVSAAVVNASSTAIAADAASPAVADVESSDAIDVSVNISTSDAASRKDVAAAAVQATGATASHSAGGNVSSATGNASNVWFGLVW